MADYYPLISKAVAGLDKNTGEARRALYERARTALVTQLRGITPALSESDITRERLALEEAIRKIEAEAARGARLEASRDKTPAKAPEPTPKGEPPAGAAPPADTKPAEPDAPAQTGKQETRDARPQPRTPPRAPDGRSLSDQGLKGFRDVVAEAETLGGATAQASKSARAAFASVPTPGTETQRTEPHIEPEGLRPSPRRPVSSPRPPPPPARANGRAGVPSPQHPDETAREAPLPREPARGSPADARRPDDLTAPDDLRAPEEVRLREVEPRERDYSTAEFPEHPFPFSRGDEPRRRHTVLQDDQVGPVAASRNFGPLIAIAAVIVLVVMVIGMGAWQWPKISGMLKGSQTVVGTPAPSPADNAQTNVRPKIPDRISSQDRASQPPAAAVAQRVVLYEEDPGDPAGKRYVGSAVWRTEQVAAGPGQPPEPVVRAEIEIPERKVTVKWSLRRNTDKSLPASHTIEIMFTLPPDFPHGAITNIPGILMKQAEQTRGVPLAGLAVKVTDGFFLIGLSSVETDMQRNIQLLKERSWFDVPVVYSDGRRAIMAVEKGNPGDRAFNDAFAAWGQ